MQCKQTLKLIMMQHSGERLTAMLRAWERYPTLKGDCPLERSMKKAAREAYAEKIIKGLIVT